VNNTAQYQSTVVFTLVTKAKILLTQYGSCEEKSPDHEESAWMTYDRDFE